MEAMASALSSFVSQVAGLAIPIVQLFGIFILLVTATKCGFHYFRRQSYVGVELARGTALALEFMLGAEVLHIVNAHEWKELGVLGVGVIIHILLTILLHREVREGKEEGEEPIEKKKARAAKETDPEA